MCYQESEIVINNSSERRETIAINIELLIKLHDRWEEVNLPCIFL